MRKITNLIAPILRKYRYRNKPDPFLEFKKLRNNEILPNTTKGNVLILPIRVAPVSNLIEGVYGYALRLRGYKVHGLFCAQHLNKCETINNTGLNYNCSLCNNEQDKFVETFEILKHKYEDILDINTRIKLRDNCNKIQLDTIFNLVYDNVNLGIHIKSAVLRFTLTSDVNIKKNEKLIREFMYSTITSYEACKKLLNEIKPKFVISSHGIYSTWGGALEACKKLNIPVIVWARGYVEGNLLVSSNESYAYECIVEPNSYWDKLELTLKQKEKINNYFKDKQNPKSTMDWVNYYSKHKERLKKEAIFTGQKIVKFGLFPNIPWDGTTFAATPGFPDMKIFYKSTIEWFIENPDYELIIRVHPAEKLDGNQESTKNLLLELFDELPSNVKIIEPDDSITSYDVMNECDCCIVYASSIALELAFFNKPVIQTGVFNTSNKGFVFEAKTVDEYKGLLDKASKKELVMTDDMKQRVEKYAYHWIYKRHIPENTYEHKALTFTKYNFNSSMELAPGKNKVVDWFIDRCEDGKPFIWEE